MDAEDCSGTSMYCMSPRLPNQLSSTDEQERMLTGITKTSRVQGEQHGNDFAVGMGVSLHVIYSFI